MFRLVLICGHLLEAHLHQNLAHLCLYLQGTNFEAQPWAKLEASQRTAHTTLTAQLSGGVLVEGMQVSTRARHTADICQVEGLESRAAPRALHNDSMPLD